jgi:formylglycine-generating enzyme required for sulfatase activity
MRTGMNILVEVRTEPVAARDIAPRPITQMTLGCLLIPTLLAMAVLGFVIYLQSNTATQITIPAKQFSYVYAAPNSSAPVLARFGPGQTFAIAGHTGDWRWLQVDFGADQPGWVLRPLDTLVWQLDAPEVTPKPQVAVPPQVTPVSEAMIPIPATTFTMGSPTGLGEADEQPAHSVTLSAFKIDQTEVTLGQYWLCVEAGVCLAPTNNGNSLNYSVNDPHFDNYPVTNIPWSLANSYCAWRGKRLPTEAEWELVAGWDAGRRAKITWPWGNQSDQIKANLGDNSSGAPAAVGTFPADKSPLGVLDLGGNVSEWVYDAYKVDYYAEADSTNPTGPTSRRGEGVGRVVRGGSFAVGFDQAKTTNRSHQSDYAFPNIGFRCALSQE